MVLEQFGARRRWESLKKGQCPETVSTEAFSGCKLGVRQQVLYSYVQCIRLSVYLLFTYLSTYPSIYLSIYLSIHLSSCLSSYLASQVSIYIVAFVVCINVSGSVCMRLNVYVQKNVMSVCL